MSFSSLSSQCSPRRHSNPLRCLCSWVPGWKEQLCWWSALSTTSTSGCRLLVLRENFSTFQPLVLEALVMWTQSLVSIQLGLVLFQSEGKKKPFHSHCLGGILDTALGIAGQMNMSRIFPGLSVFWNNYNFATFDGLWHWCVQTRWYALKSRTQCRLAEHKLNGCFGG